MRLKDVGAQQRQNEELEREAATPANLEFYKELPKLRSHCGQHAPQRYTPSPVYWQQRTPSRHHFRTTAVAVPQAPAPDTPSSQSKAANIESRLGRIPTRTFCPGTERKINAP